MSRFPYSIDKHLEVPKDAEVILETLMDAGYEAFVVGGCVRDCILGREPKDWDITTSARPEQVKALFKKTIDTGIQHGTVTVMMHHEGYEVTTYRIDGEYEDSRHPKEVVFTENLIEDLKRRDFTINAMAYNPRTGVVDAFDGIGDLERKLVKCVGDPMERFTEDALRIMRAVRFAAQLGFEIDGPTAEAVKVIAPRLNNISAERIATELIKMLTSPNPGHIRIAADLGITAMMLPEYDAVRGLMPNSPNHIYDVETHTIKALEAVEADQVLRLCMLLHDLGKARTEVVVRDGREVFKDHNETGAVMAGKILRRLKLDNHTREAVMKLIASHNMQYEANEVSVRKALNRVGEDLFDQFLKVQTADACAKSPEKKEASLEDLRKKRTIYDKIISEGQCFTIKGLAIGGRDLIAAGVKPGPQLGEILDQLCKRVIEDQSLNTKEQLMSLAETIRKDQAEV